MRKLRPRELQGLTKPSRLTAVKQKTSTWLCLTPKCQGFCCPHPGAGLARPKLHAGNWRPSWLIDGYYAELTGFRRLADRECKAHTFFLRSEFLTPSSGLTELKDGVVLFQNSPGALHLADPLRRFRPLHYPVAHSLLCRSFLALAWAKDFSSESPHLHPSNRDNPPLRVEL